MSTRDVAHAGGEAFDARASDAPREVASLEEDVIKARLAGESAVYAAEQDGSTRYDVDFLPRQLEGGQWGVTHAVTDGQMMMRREPGGDDWRLEAASVDAWRAVVGEGMSEVSRDELRATFRVALKDHTLRQLDAADRGVDHQLANPETGREVMQRVQQLDRKIWETQYDIDDPYFIQSEGLGALSPAAEAKLAQLRTQRTATLDEFPLLRLVIEEQPLSQLAASEDPEAFEEALQRAGTTTRAAIEATRENVAASEDFALGNSLFGAFDPLAYPDLVKGTMGELGVDPYSPRGLELMLAHDHAWRMDGAPRAGLGLLGVGLAGLGLVTPVPGDEVVGASMAATAAGLSLAAADFSLEMARYDMEVNASRVGLGAKSSELVPYEDPTFRNAMLTLSAAGALGDLANATRLARVALAGDELRSVESVIGLARLEEAVGPELADTIRAASNDRYFGELFVENGPVLVSADELAELTGSTTARGAIIPDGAGGYRMVFVGSADAAPGALTVAEEVRHAEQFLKPSTRDRVADLYEAVPDRNAWSAMPISSKRKWQLEKHELEIDAHVGLLADDPKNDELLEALDALIDRRDRLEQTGIDELHTLDFWDPDEPPWLYQKRKSDYPIELWERRNEAIRGYRSKIDRAEASGALVQRDVEPFKSHPDRDLWPADFSEADFYRRERNLAENSALQVKRTPFNQWKAGADTAGRNARVGREAEDRILRDLGIVNNNYRHTYESAATGEPVFRMGNDRQGNPIYHTRAGQPVPTEQVNALPREVGPGGERVPGVATYDMSYLANSTDAKQRELATLGVVVRPDAVTDAAVIDIKSKSNGGVQYLDRQMRAQRVVADEQKKKFVVVMTAPAGDVRPRPSAMLADVKHGAHAIYLEEDGVFFVWNLDAKDWKPLEGSLNSLGSALGGGR